MQHRYAHAARALSASRANARDAAKSVGTVTRPPNTDLQGTEGPQVLSAQIRMHMPSMLPYLLLISSCAEHLMCALLRPVVPLVPRLVAVGTRRVSCMIAILTQGYKPKLVSKMLSRAVE